MSFDDEISDAFADVDDAIGEAFTFCGGTYRGVFSYSVIRTSMLTGGFNSVSTITLRANKSQFGRVPDQRGGPVKRLKDNTQWAVAEIDPNDSTHYVFTLKVLLTK